MFINSEQLINKIKLVSNEIALRSNGKITFEEYISLPYYGYIILRFNLNENCYSIADLDRYEAMMYDCVKDDFLIDFMGNVYRKIGIDYCKMDKLFSECLDCYRNEKLNPSSYAKLIENDAKHLLASCAFLLICQFGRFKLTMKFTYSFLAIKTKRWDDIIKTEYP